VIAKKNEETLIKS